ncbi:MAG TPA: hypothetical protein PKJ96_10260 [Thiobacillaceae bacterium]|nr:hypothetical protein [Thiobacillaceae bacterium]
MTDELAPEDQLRLQVLLAQDVKAVRLDEGSMTLHALTPGGEASIALVPNCRADRYARLVREQLSGHALGSPGGYPVFLSRWTRHGQVEGLNLGKLLLTGEPEAVVAVVHSPALTDELAEYAWWAQPSIENARLMLCRESVARGRMGPVLAAFLAEHLPFLQDDHLGIMDTVAVLIYSGALGPAQLETVWNRGRHSNSYYVAFLEMAALDTPHPLPCLRTVHPDLAVTQAALGDPPRPGDLAARALLKAFSAEGQAFLAAAADILARPETQEVVSRTLNAIGRYFGSGGKAADTAGVPDDAALRHRLDAAGHLAMASDASLQAIFIRSTAIGSLMRRKIEPVVTPLVADIQRLLAENRTGASRRPSKPR